MSIRTSPATWIVAASKAGADTNPAWYHNLLAHPDTTIETPDDGQIAVHARDLEGEERNAAWKRFTDISPGFRSYETQTARTIPVLEFTRSS